MVHKRKDQKVSQIEIDAVAQFFQQNPQFDTEENGTRLSDYLLNTWGVVIDAESLEIAKQKLLQANVLTVLSASAVKLKTVIANYSKEPLDAFTKWFDQQTGLANQGDEGLENAANLLTELRGREISVQKISEAIGRLQFRGTRLYFNQAAKSDRPPEMRLGLQNHAANASAHKPGVMFDRNEVNQDPLDAKRHKFDPTPDQAGTNQDDRGWGGRWQAKADSVRGSSHSITEQAKRIVVTVPGTRQIDWEATFNARERFVGADRSVR
jgi:hypothetical protein